MSTRLLIAGIGNIFLGDDAFGVETVWRLLKRPQPEGVRVIDFGIRGFDLTCALLDGYEGAILVDAVQRGQPPGTLFVIEPETTAGEVPTEGHDLHPAKVLQLARSMGEPCAWVRVVGCEPLTFGSEENPVMGLSPPVQQALEEAIPLIETLVRNFLDGQR